jgi:hypothetical protein
MKIAVLFDGAGLARLGLEQAGHDCTGFELNPIAHHLSQYVGSGNCILADVRDVDLSEYDAAWQSPPCQWRSTARDITTRPVSKYSDDLLEWSLTIKERWPHLKVHWVENVLSHRAADNTWGKIYNAAQFLEEPIQNRNRVIGGEYPAPDTVWEYQKKFDGVCPCITATEWNGHANDTRRASRWYGRRLTCMNVHTIRVLIYQMNG